MPKDLLNKTVLDAINLERYKSGEVAKISPILKKLNTQISLIVLAMDVSNRVKVNNDLKRIYKLIDEAFDKIGGMSDASNRELIKLYISKEIKAVSENSDLTPIESKDEKKGINIVLASLVLGSKLPKALDTIKRDVKTRLTSQVRVGISDNEDATSLARRVKGTTSRRFKDGVLDKTLRDLGVLTKTSIQTFTNRSKLWVWGRMGVSQYIWLSTLDSGTTPICWRRSTKIYQVGQGPLPPAHFGCRSSVARYVKGMKIPQNYGDWLRQQSRSIVEDVLGVKKGGMFLSGKLPLSKFTTPAGRGLTIEELTQRM